MINNMALKYSPKEVKFTDKNSKTLFTCNKINAPWRSRVEIINITQGESFSFKSLKMSLVFSKILEELYKYK